MYIGIYTYIVLKLGADGIPFTTIINSTITYWIIV